MNAAAPKYWSGRTFLTFMFKPDRFIDLVKKSGCEPGFDL